MRSRIRHDAERDWLGLTEASRRLGLSASTLRRWADDGTIRSFVTPGGHRRFSRSAVDALVSAPTGSRPPMAELGETTTRMSRVYHRAVAGARIRPPALGELGPVDRARFRVYGRAIIEGVLAALDADDPSTRQVRLASATASATEHGSTAARRGLSLSATVEAFLRFRRPFLEELAALARRRDLGAAETAGLLDDACAMFDGLLLSTLAGYEATTAVRA